MPLIFLFGAYVIMNGHLSAGGGFQGGAVVASGVVLLMLAFPDSQLHHGFLSVTESLAGVLYVSIGILGLVFAGGFLDSHILPSGDFGTLFSAGAIPAHIDAARHQGRRRAQRRHRPVPQLSRPDEVSRWVCRFHTFFWRQGLAWS